MTGEDWVDIMYAAMATQPTIAPILFISFTILINFILLNVIIGIICVNFEMQDEEKQEKQKIKYRAECEKLVRKQLEAGKTADYGNPYCTALAPTGPFQ